MMIIFGASGFLGRYLFRYFKESCPHAPVIGTYHKHPVEALVHYDLTQASPETLGLKEKKIRYAIICSGQTGIDAIKKEPGHFREVNVTHTIELIRYLTRMGITPVYISTDNVFDGTKGNYREEDVRNPLNLYGRQKKEVEDILMRDLDNYLIIRLNKLYATDPDAKNWLGKWVQALSRHQSISCDTTQYFCPTHAEDIAPVIDKLISANKKGVYHIANPRVYTYMEVAAVVCDRFGFEKNLLKAVEINRLGLLEKRPLKISLNSEKIFEETGYTCRDITETILSMKSPPPGN